MRLTTKDSIMGRKHDIKGGCARDWKPKLKNYRYELIEEVVDKLGEFEDNEEELGVDLVTLFKALKDGFYAYKGNDIVEIKSKPGNCGAMNFYASYDCIIAEDVFEQRYIYSLKDYGVTWALTREELETRKEN